MHAIPIMMAPKQPRSSQSMTCPGPVPSHRRSRSRSHHCFSASSIGNLVPEGKGKSEKAKPGPFAFFLLPCSVCLMLHRRIGLEQSQVFVLGVAVGHARDVIADDALGTALFDPARVTIGQLLGS